VLPEQPLQGPSGRLAGMSGRKPMAAGAAPAAAGGGVWRLWGAFAYPPETGTSAFDGCRPVRDPLWQVEWLLQLQKSLTGPSSLRRDSYDLLWLWLHQACH